MRTALLCAAALVLAACQTCPKPDVVTVKVPVQVPCIKTKPTKPPYEAMGAELADGDVVLALGRNWLLSRKYEAELEATVAGCE